LKDNSYISQTFETLIKIPERKEIPIKAGTVLNFGGALVYELSELKPDLIKLDLIA
jgi:hypothetical protein